MRLLVKIKLESISVHFNFIIQFIVRIPVYTPQHSTMWFLVNLIIILIGRREVNITLKKKTHKD